jgi:hypothetical protein
MRPCRGDGFLTTAEAAALVGARPVTVRRWRMLGYLAPQGLDERGYPLHTPEAVRAAERRVRANLRYRPAPPPARAATSCRRGGLFTSGRLCRV